MRTTGERPWYNHAPMRGLYLSASWAAESNQVSPLEAYRMPTKEVLRHALLLCGFSSVCHVVVPWGQGLHPSE